MCCILMENCIQTVLVRHFMNFVVDSFKYRFSIGLR